MKLRILLLACLSLTLCAVAQRRPPPGGGRPPDRFPQGVDTSQNMSNQVSIRISGGYRYFNANGIPVHQTGQFPNRNNPNSVRPQQYQFRVSLNPQVNKQATILANGLGTIGVALNGVPMEPGAAEFWKRDFNSGWQYEAKGGSINLGLDEHNAHVQPSGSYHYHGMPTGLVKRLASKDQMVHVGYAADGFPIYARYGYRDPKNPKSGIVSIRPSFRVRKGLRPGGPGGQYDGTFMQDYEYVKGLGHLDECNGRFGVTPEYPEGIYHYYITDQWPYLPRAFRGSPDESFSHSWSRQTGSARRRQARATRQTSQGGG